MKEEFELPELEEAFEVRDYFRDLAINYDDARADELLDMMDNIITLLEKI